MTTGETIFDATIPLRCLRIEQPAASLIAHGRQRMYPLGTWAQAYDGLVGIYAPFQTWASVNEKAFACGRIRNTLRDAGFTSTHQLPTGKLIALAMMKARVIPRRCAESRFWQTVPDAELEFSDLTPGTTAGKFSLIARFAPPIELAHGTATFELQRDNPILNIGQPHPIAWAQIVADVCPGCQRPIVFLSPFTSDDVAYEPESVHVCDIEPKNHHRIHVCPTSEQRA